jgi:hypothetical protein
MFDALFYFAVKCTFSGSHSQCTFSHKSGDSFLTGWIRMFKKKRGEKWKNKHSSKTLKRTHSIKAAAKFKYESRKLWKHKKTNPSVTECLYQSLLQKRYTQKQYIKLVCTFKGVSNTKQIMRQMCRILCHIIRHIKLRH